MSNKAFKFDHVHLLASDPKVTAAWYVDKLGASITADTVARGAAQIFMELGGTTLIIRGQRPGEAPAVRAEMRRFGDFSSHDEWGIDHFGFLYEGDLTAFCGELRAKGVAFPVELKRGVNGSLLCYVAAPDGVSIELMQC